MRDLAEEERRPGLPSLVGQLQRIGDAAADVHAGLDGLEGRLVRMEAEALLLAMRSLPARRGRP